MAVDTKYSLLEGDNNLDLHRRRYSPYSLLPMDAIEANSYWDKPMWVTKGNVQQALVESDNLFEGEFRVGGQEHFYMETNVSLVIPQDNDEYEAFVSSQTPRDNQVTLGNLGQLGQPWVISGNIG